jgi:hypothetical protein
MWSYELQTRKMNPFKFYEVKAEAPKWNLVKNERISINSAIAVTIRALCKFEVFTEVSMKNAVFWEPCGSC